MIDVSIHHFQTRQSINARPVNPSTPSGANTACGRAFQGSRPPRAQTLQNQPPGRNNRKLRQDARLLTLPQFWYIKWQQASQPAKGRSHMISKPKFTGIICLLVIILPIVIWSRTVPTVKIVVLPGATRVEGSSEDIGPPLYCDECDGQRVCFDGSGNVVLRPFLGTSNTFHDGYADLWVSEYQGHPYARGYLGESGSALLVVGA